MKLLAYLIDGQKVGIDLKTYQNEDLNGNIPFKVSDSIETGYADGTSLESWSTFGFLAAKDYKYIRNQIMVLAWEKMLGDPVNWNNLTLEEKRIAASWFVVPKDLRDTVLSTEEQIIYAENFDSQSVQCRELRFNKTKYEIYNRLTIEQGNIILNEIEESVSTVTPNLRDKYIIYGREGTTEGDPEGLFDYVLGRADTSWEGDGFKAHDYTPVGYASMTLFADALMDILKNGNY